MKNAKILKGALALTIVFSVSAKIFGMHRKQPFKSEKTSGSWPIGYNGGVTKLMFSEREEWSYGDDKGNNYVIVKGTDYSPLDTINGSHGYSGGGTLRGNIYDFHDNKNKKLYTISKIKENDFNLFVSDVKGCTVGALNLGDDSHRHVGSGCIEGNACHYSDKKGNKNKYAIIKQGNGEEFSVMGSKDCSKTLIIPIIMAMVLRWK